MHDQVISVGGIPVAGMPKHEVAQKINNGKRPLTVAFASVGGTDKTAHVEGERVVNFAEGSLGKPALLPTRAFPMRARERN